MIPIWYLSDYPIANFGHNLYSIKPDNNNFRKLQGRQQITSLKYPKDLIPLNQID
jgi:hypothetical protein